MYFCVKFVAFWEYSSVQEMEPDQATDWSFSFALLPEHLNRFSPWLYRDVTSELFIIFPIEQNIVQEES